MKCVHIGSNTDLLYLQKIWASLKRSDQDKSEGKNVKKGKSKRHRNSLDVCEKQNIVDTRKKSDTSCGRLIGLTQFITDTTNLEQIVQHVVEDKWQITEGSPHFSSSQVDEVEISNNSRTEIACTSKTVAHSSHEVICANSSETVDIRWQMEKMDIKPDYDTYSPTDLKKPMDSSAFSPKVDEARSSNLENSVMSTTITRNFELGLVGLHTCGNLASSSIRLFLSNPEVNFLCNVGCCYHLIEEEFSKNVFVGPHYSEKNSGDGFVNALEDESLLCSEHKIIRNCTPLMKKYASDASSDLNYVPQNPLHPSEITGVNYGFPLSSCLKEDKFCIGRNCRMLSCQPADRLAEGQFVSNLLYSDSLLTLHLIEQQII